jgi:hypothetical protein
LIAQNKVMLITSVAIMTEFDKNSADDILNGKAKVAISRGVIEKVTKRAEDSREKPVLCYTEKDGEGFVGIKWIPVDHTIKEGDIDDG